MEDIFKVCQISEYHYFTKGLEGCLFLVYPHPKESARFEDRSPKLYLLKFPWRKEDKKPFIDRLHEKEKEMLWKTEPLLMGYPAWLCAKRFFEGEKVFPLSCDEYFDEMGIINKRFGEKEIRYYESIGLGNPMLTRVFGQLKWFDYHIEYIDDLNSYIRKDYLNPNLLDACGKFYNDRALLDTTDFNNNDFTKNCKIHIDDNKQIYFLEDREFLCARLSLDSDYVLDEVLREEQPGVFRDNYCVIYEKCTAPYTCHGFIAALLNMARNYAVYLYAINNYHQDVLELLEITLDSLLFDSQVPIAQLYEKYLTHVENNIRFIQERDPKIATPDIKQIDSHILSEEKKSAKYFMEETVYPQLLNKEQLEIIQTYCNGFQEYVMKKIGHNPPKTTSNTPLEIQSAEWFELLPEEGWKLMERAKAKGWLDENFRPTLSQPKAALLADAIATQIKLENKWVVFEQLWGLNQMSSKYQKATQMKYYAEVEKQISDILNNP